MVALMQRNIVLNNLEGKVSASIYDWGGTLPATVPQHPDIILAGEREATNIMETHSKTWV